MGICGSRRMKEGWEESSPHNKSFELALRLFNLMQIQKKRRERGGVLNVPRTSEGGFDEEYAQSEKSTF